MGMIIKLDVPVVTSQADFVEMLDYMRSNESITDEEMLTSTRQRLHILKEQARVLDSISQKIFKMAQENTEALEYARQQRDQLEMAIAEKNGKITKLKPGQSAFKPLSNGRSPKDKKKELAKLIKGLSPEQIKALMALAKQKGGVK